MISALRRHIGLRWRNPFEANGEDKGTYSALLSEEVMFKFRLKGLGEDVSI